MRLLYLLKTTRLGPASRHRFLQFIPALERAGFKVTVRPLFGDRYFDIIGRPRDLKRELRRGFYSALRFAARTLHTLDVARFDLVVIEHQCFPYLPPLHELFIGIARSGRRKPKVVVEFDDAIYLTRLHGPKLSWLVKWADHVIAGNFTLASWAHGHAAGRTPVSVVPTVIDASAYRPRDEWKISAPARVGWTGLPYNYPMLRSIADALGEVGREIELKLVVLSRTDPGIEQVEVELIDWNEQNEPAIIRSFDVGLMPLFDDEWSRGKCGAKLLHYMAAAVPAVASPYGVNEQILGSGAGLAARGHEQWVTALRRLLTDENLRRELGRHGREVVGRQYSLQAWEDKIPRIYEAIIEGRDTGHIFHP